MKKVSFIKELDYTRKAIEILGSDYHNGKSVLLDFFRFDVQTERFTCIKSFTAEITVKIVPYEQQ